MILGLDFGASTVDLVKFEKNKICGIRSFESSKFPKLNLQNFFDEVIYKIKDFDKIHVTGGRSKYFVSLYTDKPVKKISEINAIGRGANFLIKDRKIRKFLAVSLGTGTCMVLVNKDKKGRIRCKHVGGTGVGGGTFLGLTKELLGVTDVKKVLEMYKKGDPTKVDLSVGEIVGAGIGMVGPYHTASNLGKVSREIKFKKEDLACGIVNLIGQSIATTVVFAAKSHKCKTIVLGGKLTRIKQIVKVIKGVADLHKIELVIPKDSLYMSAIGSVVQ